MTAYEILNIELKKAGVHELEHLGSLHTPVEVLIHSKLSSKPFLSILLKYLPELTGNDQSMVVRALTEKGNAAAVPFLIDILNNPNGATQMELWAVSNALSVIDDPNFYSLILQICRQKNLGIARQMLMGVLAKIKTAESFDLLLELLNDTTVKAHAIEALGKFGDPKAIPFLEKLVVQKGQFEFKARQTALKRLVKKL